MAARWPNRRDADILQPALVMKDGEHFARDEAAIVNSDWLPAFERQRKREGQRVEFGPVESFPEIRTCGDEHDSGVGISLGEGVSDRLAGLDAESLCAAGCVSSGTALDPEAGIAVLVVHGHDHELSVDEPVTDGVRKPCATLIAWARRTLPSSP